MPANLPTESAPSLLPDDSALHFGDHRWVDLHTAMRETCFEMALPSGKCKALSASATAVFGHPVGSLCPHPFFLHRIVAASDRARFETQWKALENGEVPESLEYVVCGADGGERTIHQVTRGVFDAEGKLSGILALCRDVSAERAAQRALEGHLQILEGTFDATSVAIAFLDPQMHFVRVNQAYANADHHAPDFYPGKDHFALFPSADNERIFARVRDTGERHVATAKPFEYAHAPERGTTHWDWMLTPVKDASGQVTGLVLALLDVSERIHAIEALRDSEARITKQLEEKSVLLRELHHRVTNNLQLISSLLSLQASRATDPATQQMVEDCRARVHAMALVHETLFSRHERTGRADVGVYLSRIADAVHASYAPEGVNTRIETEITGSLTNIDDAVPCGLLASELLVNAFKHAFVGRTEGRVWLRVRALDDTNLCLEVEDDGVGFARELTEASSLGMTLVRALARQLRGTLQVGPGSDGNGSRISLTFANQPAPGRP